MEQFEHQLTAADGVLLDGLVTRPRGLSRGAVVMVHGITVDLHEGGAFDSLAKVLAADGFATLQFSFRGHGASRGTQAGVTIAGELLDFDAAFEFVRGWDLPTSVVASSFGAVATCLSLRRIAPWLDRLVLWNPVLDLVHTFVAPTLPWGLKNFGDRARAALRDSRYFLVDDDFRLGWVLFEEFAKYTPLEEFVHCAVQSRTIHCDQDSYVSFDIAKRAADLKRNSTFHSVRGSDHGFSTQADVTEAVTETRAFIVGEAAE